MIPFNAINFSSNSTSEKISLLEITASPSRKGADKQNYMKNQKINSGQPAIAERSKK